MRPENVHEIRVFSEVGRLGPAVTSVLKQHGFRLHEALQAVVADAGDRISFDPETLWDPDNWYLTDADVDT